MAMNAKHYMLTECLLFTVNSTLSIYRPFAGLLQCAAELENSSILKPQLGLRDIRETTFNRRSNIKGNIIGPEEWLLEGDRYEVK